MKSFRQWLLEWGFAKPEEHPLHRTAVSHGFSHDATSNALGASTHQYTHPKGHSLMLRTSSGGQHSFAMTSKSGKTERGETPMHLMGASMRLREAELPNTFCAVCGKKGHPAAIHQAKALAPENNLKESSHAYAPGSKWGFAVPAKNKHGFKIVKGDEHPTSKEHTDLAQKHFKKNESDLLKNHHGVRYLHHPGSREFSLELSTHPKSIAVARKLVANHHEIHHELPDDYFVDFVDKDHHSFDAGHHNHVDAKLRAVAQKAN